MRIQTKAEKEKRSFFDYVTEVIGWLLIVVSPLLTGLLIAALIYFPNRTTFRLVIAIAISITGLIAGVILAIRIWKKHGTIYFVSRTMATPELDNPDKENE